ncbi:hypothetical protein [Nonomuraea sp. NPDC049400]|uniref:hypothetical protein n=1 Tax=Nonomuraea sp. NPDC049400 TaxID=3364352 RepID=UPI0037BD9508
MMTPEQRVLRAQIAAHVRWSKTPNAAEATAPARKAFHDRFERQVDPNNEMDPVVRAKLAEHAKKAYYKQLALKSARARAARKTGGDRDAA